MALAITHGRLQLRTTASCSRYAADPACTHRYLLTEIKWLYASSIVYIPAAYFTKVTLLLLIAHVFAVNERIAKGIHLFIWVLLFMYTPIQTIKITICVPIEDYWLPSVAPRCINQRKIFIVDTSIAVFVDLVILLLPIFMTWSLTMSPRKKLKIMLMLGAGGGATAATLFRLVTAIRCIELTIGLVCACLPSVNVLFKRHQSSRERARISTSPHRPIRQYTPGRLLQLVGYRDAEDANS
ncbi:integral membrane protein [Colletotrichum tofieldiae]|nr:integral membrane protein [Colletotrichum tofieldiae]